MIDKIPKSQGWMDGQPGGRRSPLLKVQIRIRSVAVKNLAEGLGGAFWVKHKGNPIGNGNNTLHRSSVFDLRGWGGTGMAIP